MAITIVENSCYVYGGHANRNEICREIVFTGTVAADFAAAATIDASLLMLTKVTQPATVINATGQALDLVPSFDGTKYVIFPKGTYTLTDLVFKGFITGR